MSEANLSRRLTNKLAPHLKEWHRVENSVNVGTPDVFYIGRRWPGWVELKHVHTYPSRPATTIKFKRYTIEQARCIERFGQNRCASWILIQVGRDHWLFDWTKAIELQETQPLAWWEENCFEVWKGRLDYCQLAAIL